ncbi:tryptophan synthase subunit alpha [Amnimonas aquatica]|uniref:Tryptophan synthase alpha chain n=1 Tax=Amnimonas aquatica TaxID=2094561 RepID=A0A2P6ARY5_9GAMM|nr:tryptophan synthase subunit alpha [Amnimonas aquatica]PQA40154.1 tryptophan synthase subunit alpha [Amnimonas aquatica]
MSRLSALFQSFKTRGRKALIPYIVAGDPEPGVTVAAMHALVAGGADIIELGVPFSDPMADGPTITLGHERALKHGTSLHDVLAMVAEFRSRDAATPVVLMGYLNPVEITGYVAFADAAAAAGVDGVLTVDLPPEEAEGLSAELARVGIDPIYLLAPTTTLARAARITAAASGYVYYVSLKGVTGAATLDVEAVSRRIAELRSVTQLPIGVGFGIKDATSAAAVARHADGVVVGSVLVQCIGDHAVTPASIPDALTRILAPMRAAIDQA